jgi:aquaporin Z
MHKYLAEFLGTVLFLYVIIATKSPVPIAVSLLIAIMVFGPYSGGHFNPAVSVMMTATKKLSSSDLLPYVLAQVAGGLAALELHKRIKF